MILCNIKHQYYPLKKDRHTARFLISQPHNCHPTFHRFTGKYPNKHFNLKK